MCFHGNRPSLAINDSINSLDSNYQSPSFISLPIMLAPFILRLDEISLAGSQNAQREE